MPAKNKSKVTETQRRKIAAGKATGKTAKQIAAATGLAQRTVEKHALDARTLALVVEYKAASRAEFDHLWKRLLVTLKRDIDSNDADIRRHARTQFMKLLVLGESPIGREDVPDPQDGDFTLEELLRVSARLDITFTGGLPR